MLFPTHTQVEAVGMKITPNRIAVYLTAVAALLGGIAPAVADLDPSSTAGIVTGLVAVTAVVNKWLDGWQRWETETQWQDHARFMAELGHDPEGHR